MSVIVFTFKDIVIVFSVIFLCLYFEIAKFPCLRI